MIDRTKRRLSAFDVHLITATAVLCSSLQPILFVRRYFLPSQQQGILPQNVSMYWISRELRTSFS